MLSKNLVQNKWIKTNHKSCVWTFKDLCTLRSIFPNSRVTLRFFNNLNTLLWKYLQYYTLFFSISIAFRHNILSCLAHYWTLILSENFWLDWIFDSTLLLLAIVPKCKIHAVPSLVDLIGKWDSSWFGPKSENADLISIITHTHTELTQ